MTEELFPTHQPADTSAAFQPAGQAAAGLSAASRSLPADTSTAFQPAGQSPATRPTTAPDHAAKGPASSQASEPPHPAVLLQHALDSVEQVDVVGLSVPELKHVSGLAGRMKARMDSVLCSVASEVTASGSTATATGVLQSSPHLSRRDAGRLANVADGLAEMPNVKARLDSGDISVDHANALVKTAQTAGPAAVDSNAELLDLAGEVSPDKFAKEAKRAAIQASEDRGEAELDRQRRDRRASAFTDPDSGMGRLSADFDPIKFELVRQALDGHVDTLWRADNELGRAATGLAGSACDLGRSGCPSRSMDQRRLDAVFELITRLDASTHEPLAGEAGKPSVSTQLVIVADLGLIDGTDPFGRCEIPGVGPVPPSVLEQLSPDTQLAGMIFGGDGQPLWLGKSRRRFNAHQRLAVAVRDGGCVECGAPMHLCDIHHVREWEHDGPTDIENLVALCRQHHRQHHGNLTYRYRSRSGGKARGPTGATRSRPLGPDSTAQASPGLPASRDARQRSRGHASRRGSPGPSRGPDSNGQSLGQEPRRQTGDRPRGRTRGSSGRAVPGTSSESDDPDH